MKRTIERLFESGTTGHPNGILYDLVKDIRIGMQSIAEAADEIGHAARAISKATESAQPAQPAQEPRDPGLVEALDLIMSFCVTGHLLGSDGYEQIESARVAILEAIS